MLLFLALSYIGHAYFENIEEDWLNHTTGACQTESFSQEQARLDALLESTKRTGALNCYCEELFNDESLQGLAVKFTDEEQHCMTWYYEWI